MAMVALVFEFLILVMTFSLLFSSERGLEMSTFLSHLSLEMPLLSPFLSSSLEESNE